MKRKPTANPSSLFLLELIFAILFFFGGKCCLRTGFCKIPYAQH